MNGELHSVVSPSEILVLTPKGQLRQVSCPFRVLCVSTIGNIEYNSFCFVQRVEEGTVYNTICYLIEGVLYPHRHFRIYLSF